MTKIDISFMPVAEQVEMVKKYLQSREQHKVQGDVKLQQVMAHFKHQDLMEPKAKHAYFKKLYLAALGKTETTEEIKIKKPVKPAKKRYTPQEEFEYKKAPVNRYRSTPRKDNREYTSYPAKKQERKEDTSETRGNNFKQGSNDYKSNYPVKERNTAEKPVQDNKSRKDKIKDRKLNNESPPLYGDVKPYQKKPYKRTNTGAGSRKSGSGVYITDGAKTYGGVYRDESAPGFKKERPKKSGGFDDRKDPRQRTGKYNDRRSNRSY